MSLSAGSGQTGGAIVLTGGAGAAVGGTGGSVSVVTGSGATPGGFEVRSASSGGFLALQASAASSQLNAVAVSLTASDSMTVSGASGGLLMSATGTGDFLLRTTGTGKGSITTASNAGSTGSLEIRTGANVAGTGTSGAISLTVGVTDSGTGGNIVLSAGAAATAAGTTGGSVVINAGAGTTAPGFIKLNGLLALKSLGSAVGVTNTNSDLTPMFTRYPVSLSGAGIDQLTILATAGAYADGQLLILDVNGANRLTLNVVLVPGAGNAALCLTTAAANSRASITLLYSATGDHWITILAAGVSSGACV